MRLPPFFLGLAILLLACGEREPGAATEEAAGEPLAGDTAAPGVGASRDSMVAHIQDSAGRSLGTITIRASGGGVSLSGSLRGLPPGEHGFHIHETGRCEPPSFSSAGSHFAPGGNEHGFDATGGPHAGDLRNLTVGPDSTAIVHQANPRVTLRGWDNALLDADGSALVIHAGADDYVTQPSGGSGDPIACGVIEG